MKYPVLTALPLCLGLACASSGDGKSETAKTAKAAEKPAAASQPAAEAEKPAEAAPAAASAVPARKDDANRKSKNGKVEAEIGGAKVMVQYGRPSARGRKIFGEIVSYGKLWRTGADEATTITFDADVMVEGKKLGKGTYALFTVPGEKAWTIVFNTVAEQWGAYNHDDSKDALRVEVATAATEAPVETFTIRATADQLVLEWEKTMVGVKIAAGS